MSPHKIERITPKDVGRFSIDDKNNLYWDGQLIHTEAVVKLSKFQSLVVICAGFATMATSAAAWTTYLTVARKTVPQPKIMAAATSPCAYVPNVPAPQMQPSLDKH